MITSKYRSIYFLRAENARIKNVFRKIKLKISTNFESYFYYDVNLQLNYHFIYLKIKLETTVHQIKNNWSKCAWILLLGKIFITSTMHFLLKMIINISYL